jgi:hypothetical protein
LQCRLIGGVDVSLVGFGAGGGAGVGMRERRIMLDAPVCRECTERDRETEWVSAQDDADEREEERKREGEVVYFCERGYEV